MPPARDLTGQKFGRLTVLNRAAGRIRGGKPRTYWLCKCDCGQTVEVMTDSLLSRNTRSCWCLLAEKTKARMRTHGYSDTKTYNAWAAAKSRCTNPKHPSFKHYGARGIYMAVEWADSFEQFVADMGAAPLGMELEREDNDGPYSPWNCKWATRQEQMNNTQRNVGSLAVFARTNCVSYGSIWARVQNGQSREQAVAELRVSKRHHYKG